MHDEAQHVGLRVEAEQEAAQQGPALDVEGLHGALGQPLLNRRDTRRFVGQMAEIELLEGQVHALDESLPGTPLGIDEELRAQRIVARGQSGNRSLQNYRV